MKRIVCYLAVILSISMVLGATPMYAKDNSSDTKSKVYYADNDRTDKETGEVVAKKHSQISFSPKSIDKDGMQSVTVTEIISYNLLKQDYNKVYKNNTIVTKFSVDKAGNTYINGKLFKDGDALPQISNGSEASASDSGGYWKYTDYSCTTVQCYLYTANGVDSSLNPTSAYKYIYLDTNSSNAYVINSFKMYANSVANDYNNYNNYMYAFVIAGGATVLSGGILAIVTGGGAAIAFYEAMQSLSSLNSDMGNAYSLF